MKIQKRERHDKKSGDVMYGKCYGRILQFTSAVRDAFSPYTHVRVDFDEEGIILTPTNDENEYKLIVAGGQMRVSWSYAARLRPLPKGVAMPVERMESGFKFLMRVPEGELHG